VRDEEQKQEEIKPTEILKELANIRTSIDKFLEKFDKFLKLDINLQKLEGIFFQIDAYVIRRAINFNSLI
jgi:hypothetical protein